MQIITTGSYHRPIGVHNIQVFRANRAHPEWAGGTAWTYSHQPMLAYWHDTFTLNI